MKIEKKDSIKKIIARIFLVIIPAIAIGAYMLWHLNEYYSVLQSQWFIESFFLAAGIISGCLFYSFRFRFITTVLPLVLSLFIIGKIVSNIYTGEFIAFYAITKFYISLSKRGHLHIFFLFPGREYILKGYFDGLIDRKYSI